MAAITFLYTITIWKIYAARAIRSTAAQTDNLVIFTKLFFVVGILLICELLAPVVKNDMFTIIFSVLNLSRGTAMFLVFCVKEKPFILAGQIQSI